MENRTYFAIDLKSFFASVECVEMGLNPFSWNLVVADESRTDKTICLAASPAIKTFGVPGRARLFEVKQIIEKKNSERLKNAPENHFTGKSANIEELKNNPSLKIDIIINPPKMALYMDYSSRVINTYLKFISEDDLYMYSIDECFIDATHYLYKKTPREFLNEIIKAVYDETGITATAGIGTNLFLSKIAMDILAKRSPPDIKGARIAELNETSFRYQFWDYTPLTDFWGIGPGTSQKLENLGIHTMGDIALCSVGKEDDFFNINLLHKIFGKNSICIINHAWGYDPSTIASIKSFIPKNNSLSSGQVLPRPYSFDEGKIILLEMADAISLDMANKKIIGNQIAVIINYDKSNKVLDKTNTNESENKRYRYQPLKPSHGLKNLNIFTSSSHIIKAAAAEIYENIVDRNLTIKQITITVNHIVSEIFETDLENEKNHDKANTNNAKNENEETLLKKEQKLQGSLVYIKSKYGNNTILKGLNYHNASTGKNRNNQIGGHTS